jgi:hypothetical protein
MFFFAAIFTYLTCLVMTYAYSLGDSILFSDRFSKQFRMFSNYEVGEGPIIFSIGNIDFCLFPIWLYSLPEYVQNKFIDKCDFIKLGKSIMVIILGVIFKTLPYVLPSLPMFLSSIGLCIFNIGIVGLIFEISILNKALPTKNKIVNKIFLLLTNFYTFCNIAAIYMIYCCIIFDVITEGLTYGI